MLVRTSALLLPACFSGLFAVLVEFDPDPVVRKQKSDEHFRTLVAAVLTKLSEGLHRRTALRTSLGASTSSPRSSPPFYVLRSPPPPHVFFFQGRSTGRQGQNGPTSPQAGSRGKGGQSGKRKRGGGLSNRGSGSGSGGGASSRKLSAHATPATVSPPSDLCDHHACLLGSGTGTSAATVSRAGAAGGSAAEWGEGMDFLARKEAELRRWRCKSDKCRGNSYHMMCLETRAGGEPPKAPASGRDARSEAGGDDESGTEMLGTVALGTERLAVEAEDVDDDSSGSEGSGGGGLPPAGVTENLGVVMEVGEAAGVVDKRLTAITTAVAVAASMTGMKVVAVAGASLPVVAESASTGVAAMDVVPVIGLAAAAAAPAPAEEELWGWRSDLLCPECGDVVASQEEAALVQQR